VNRGVHLLGALLCLVVGCGSEPAAVGARPAGGLVFVRVVAGSTEILRARLSDSEERVVTRTPDRSERWPYWSEAAKRLVYQVSRPDRRNDSDLVLWNPATQREAALPRTPRREERWPGWAPDGSAIVYAFRGGTPASGVALARWRDHRITLLASAGPDDFYLRPNFSPDGRSLVAQRRIAERSDSSNLWLLSADAAPVALTSDPAWNDSKAWFSRDGTKIVYSRHPADGDDYDIWGIPAMGGDPYPIVAGPDGAHSARPSPSRDEIAFVSDRDGSADLFLADLDGKHQRSLGRTPDRNELAPRWSPDGELVVVTQVAREVGDLGSMNPQALAQSRIAVFDRNGKQLFEAAGAMPDWMPAWP
jgi:Tol biopolymer transport system component